MLSAVVERLLKAMPAARPRTVRQFFALVNQHMRWELNDLARRLDEQPAAVELNEGLVPAPPSSGSVLTPDGRRMLEAIDRLPEEEREVFGLVRIQGADARRGGRGPRRLGQDGAAAAEPLAGCCWRRSWITSARRRGGPAMIDDPRVDQLLEELLESGGTPEEACRSCPELLPQVRAGLLRLRLLEQEVGALFPPPTPRAASAPRPRRRPSCRGSPATRWRRSWGAAGWASSTGRGTCGSTAPSP